MADPPGGKAHKHGLNIMALEDVGAAQLSGVDAHTCGLDVHGFEGFGQDEYTRQPLKGLPEDSYTSHRASHPNVVLTLPILTLPTPPTNQNITVTPRTSSQLSRPSGPKYVVRPPRCSRRRLSNVCAWHRSIVSVESWACQQKEVVKCPRVA